jgi:hypothetical protein
MEVTKAEIVKAFNGKKYKRLALIFNFFKDQFFYKGYSAEFIANQISIDLGVEISKTVIYNINKRFINVINDKPTKEEKPPVETKEQLVKMLVIEQTKAEQIKEEEPPPGYEWREIRGKKFAIIKALTIDGYFGQTMPRVSVFYATLRVL